MVLLIERESPPRVQRARCVWHAKTGWVAMSSSVCRGPRRCRVEALDEANVAGSSAAAARDRLARTMDVSRSPACARRAAGISAAPELQELSSYASTRNGAGLPHGHSAIGRGRPAAARRCAFDRMRFWAVRMRPPPAGRAADPNRARERPRSGVAPPGPAARDDSSRSWSFTCSYALRTRRTSMAPGLPERGGRRAGAPLALAEPAVAGDRAGFGRRFCLRSAKYAAGSRSRPRVARRCSRGAPSPRRRSSVRSSSKTTP